MNENTSIFRKGLILVGVPLLSQLLFLGVLIQMRSEQISAQRMALHTKDVIADAEVLYRSVVESHNAVRAYVFFGDAVYRAVYEEAASRIPAIMQRLPDRVRDHALKEGQVSRLLGAVQDLVNFQDELYQTVKAGRQEQAIERVRTYLGQERLDAVRAELEDFLAEEERLDRERIESLEWNSRLQLWVLGGGVALAFASSGLLVWLFAHGLADRLWVLRDNARRLAEGKELSSRMTGRDEIAQLDKVFHEMAEALAQRDRDNEMFVYSVSHDLRSPLVNLQGFSQELSVVAHDLRGLLIDEAVPQGVREKSRQLIDRDMTESIQYIQTAVGRLSAIIDALLRLSRIGRVEYQIQPVDTGIVVNRVREALQNTLTEKGVRLTIQELPPCWADPTAIDQVFANLIGNAINYLDPNRPGHIEVGSQEVDEQGRQVYYVKDNGLGIPANQLPKVFAVFQRLHPNAAKGEGIGLALVRRVMDRHGGKIWVESREGEGSIFFVAFPTSAPTHPTRRTDPF